MCSCAQRLTNVFRTVGSKRASPAISCSIQANNSASRMRATLTAPAIPPRLSRSGKVRKKAESLFTAKGGAKVPNRFFCPKALTAFFTPTPESSWANTVVGEGRGTRHDERLHRRIQLHLAPRRRRQRLHTSDDR